MKARKIIAAITLLAAASMVGGARAEVGPLGLTCSLKTSLDGIGYRMCTGKVASFDGVPLDVDLSLPLGTATDLPAIVMLHGWSTEKSTWEDVSAEGTWADGYHWNNVWFVSRGFAVVNYTARGFAGSCGQQDTSPECANAWTHLADRRFETRDSQMLLSSLVDEGIADPTRLVATGGSYGGGQSWLLATSLPWRTPEGTQLQLAAAVPFYSWSDIFGAILPNGRQTDETDQSASLEDPVGVERMSLVAGELAFSVAGVRRFMSLDPADAVATVPYATAAVGVGEPYASNPLMPPQSLWRYKSAYYADEYFAALRAHTARAVPTLAMQGWTDSIFPAAEVVQMYRKLRAIDPAYPIAIQLGDVGHTEAQNPSDQYQVMNDRANAFLSDVFSGAVDKWSGRVFSFVTACPGLPVAPPFESADWDHLAGSVLSLSDGAPVTTAPAVMDPVDGVSSDPVVKLVEQSYLGATTCVTEQDLPISNGWTWTVPGSGMTMAGLPEVRISYSINGTDATAIFKLWDVFGDTKTLVTRGVWRLTQATDAMPSGEIRTKLFGNAWRFAPGHSIKLEVSQTDAPYFRPDNLPSTITFSDVRLAIPVRS